MGKVRPAAADWLIGMRIRERRVLRGPTQRELGERIGITNRQVHKYESGINVVLAGHAIRDRARIEHAARILLCFFEGLEQNESQLLPRQRMLREVMRNFGEVQNEKYLEAVRELTSALAGG